jgi:AcrR family transcriptional regulator
MPRATGPVRGGRANRSKSSPRDSARQVEIVDIAARLFAEHGYTATTVRDIADTAGILSGSLYHHVRSKEDLVDAILSEFLDGILASYDAIMAADAPPRETITQLVGASLAAIEDRRAAVVVYQNEATYLSNNPRFRYLSRAARRLREAWVTTLERGVRNGDHSPDLNPSVVYRFIRDALWTTARWYRPGGELTIEQLTDQYVRMILDGIAVHDR